MICDSSYISLPIYVPPPGAGYTKLSASASGDINSNLLSITGTWGALEYNPVDTPPSGQYISQTCIEEVKVYNYNDMLVQTDSNNTCLNGSTASKVVITTIPVGNIKQVIVKVRGYVFVTSSAYSMIADDAVFYPFGCRPAGR